MSVCFVYDLSLQDKESPRAGNGIKTTLGQLALVRWRN